MSSNLNKISSLLSWLSCILFITGCGGCEEKPLQQVELKPEAKELQVKIRHFDQDLFHADFSLPQIASQQLYQSYGAFYCDFVEVDLRIGQCQDSLVPAQLRDFVKHPDILAAHEEINKTFYAEGTGVFDAQFTDAFRKWHHYFPDSLVPSVVYYQSAWNSQAFPSDSALGIALDCYLGAENKVIRPLAFPQYQKDNFIPEFMVSDAIKAWVGYQARSYYVPKDFLSELIFYGKLMYVSEALIPDEPDHRMMRWTAEELEWAEKNEWNTWKQMATEKVMFQTRRFEIEKWFTDAPFTNAESIPQDSPPQLGVWMGWKIVRQYMAENPAVSLEQLLAEKDNQKILAFFKPNR